MFVPMHIYVCAYVHACMPVSVRMHARARVCVCVCVFKKERGRGVGGRGEGRVVFMFVVINLCQQSEFVVCGLLSTFARCAMDYHVDLCLMSKVIYFLSDKLTVL